MVSAVIVAILFTLFLGAAYMFWRHISIPVEISPEIHGSGTAAVDTPECRLAVHEAGHAVAGWCCTLVGEVSVATIEDKSGGFVRHSYYAIGGPEAEWCEMVISLAGVAAEAMVYSRWRTAGSEGDLSRSLVLAKNIGAKGQERLPWDKLGGEAGPVPDFKKMYSADLSPVVLENLEEGYRMTRQVLRSHGSRFFKMVTLLLTKRAVSRFDMEHTLGKRHFETLIAVGTRLESVINQNGKPQHFKPRFVLPLRRRKAA